jgi:CheY-like chemotaxis protein
VRVTQRVRPRLGVSHRQKTSFLYTLYIVTTSPSPSAAAPILIVDDDRNNQYLLEHRLKKLGVRNPLLAFDGGEELVSFLEKASVNEVTEPCLVLLDLKMPLLDGFDVLAWLNTRPQFKNLHVAVVTAQSQPSELARLAGLGVAEVLDKLPSEMDLARVVSWATETR